MNGWGDYPGTQEDLYVLDPQYPPLGETGRFIVSDVNRTYAWVVDDIQRRIAPNIHFVEGPVSLVDNLRLYHNAYGRSRMVLLAEQDRAALWYENYQLKKRNEELEKALLSPERAEPVIAKLLGLNN